MKKDRYTAILEFEVIAPTNDMETIGEKLKLSAFGEYCPDASMRGYSLLHLLDPSSGETKYFNTIDAWKIGMGL
jgi:hypothetical protein